MKELLAKLDLLNIDGYSFEKQMTGGKAGTTLVYKNSSEVRVVIKFLIAPSNEFMINRFKEEVNALATINETFLRTDIVNEMPVPRLIKPLVHIQELCIYYYIMEFIEGETLEKHCARRGLPLPWRDAIILIQRIASALTLSELRFIHRDLHPGNIIVLDDVKFDKNNLDFEKAGIKILDFGCTKDYLKFVMGEWSEDKFRLPGAITSWSPELLRNPEIVDSPHDSWALGMILHRLLLNKFPFEAKSHGDIMMYLSNEIELKELYASNIPTAAKNLVSCLLAINPRDRLGVGEIFDFCTAILYTDLINRSEEFLKVFVLSRASLYYCADCWYHTGEYIYNSGRLENRCPKCGVILTPDNTYSALKWL